MRRIWHILASGHVWRVAGQTVCEPKPNVATWASNFHADPELVALTVKATWGWSECLLICPCGEVRKIEMTGEQKA